MHFLSVMASIKTNLCIYSSSFPSKYNEKETMHTLCYRQYILSALKAGYLNLKLNQNCHLLLVLTSTTDNSIGAALFGACVVGFLGAVYYTGRAVYDLVSINRKISKVPKITLDEDEPLSFKSKPLEKDLEGSFHSVNKDVIDSYLTSPISAGYKRFNKEMFPLDALFTEKRYQLDSSYKIFIENKNLNIASVFKSDSQDLKFQLIRNYLNVDNIKLASPIRTDVELYNMYPTLNKRFIKFGFSENERLFLVNRSELRIEPFTSADIVSDIYLSDLFSLFLPSVLSKLSMTDTFFIISHICRLLHPSVISALIAFSHVSVGNFKLKYFRVIHLLTIRRLFLLPSFISLYLQQFKIVVKTFIVKCNSIKHLQNILGGELNAFSIRLNMTKSSLDSLSIFKIKNLPFPKKQPLNFLGLALIRSKIYLDKSFTCLINLLEVVQEILDRIFLSKLDFSKSTGCKDFLSFLNGNRISSYLEAVRIRLDKDIKTLKAFILELDKLSLTDFYRTMIGFWLDWINQNQIYLIKFISFIGIVFYMFFSA